MIGLFARGLLWAAIWTLLVIAAPRSAPPTRASVAYCPTPAGPFLPCTIVDGILRPEWDA